MANIGGTEKSGQISTTAVIAVVVLICFSISAIVGLTFAGRSVDSVIYLLSGLIAPTIGTLLASKKLDGVAKQVNGKMDNLISDKAELENQVHSMGGTPVTLPSQRSVTASETVEGSNVDGR